MIFRILGWAYDTTRRVSVIGEDHSGRYIVSSHTANLPTYAVDPGEPIRPRIYTETAGYSSMNK